MVGTGLRETPVGHGFIRDIISRFSELGWKRNQSQRPNSKLLLDLQSLKLRQMKGKTLKAIERIQFK